MARDIANALADRVPIAWDRLLAQTGSPSERASLACLRPLERFTIAGPLPATDALSRTDCFVWGLTIVSALQVACCVLWAMWRMLIGAHLHWPLPQVVLTVAFAGAAAYLVRARDDRRVWPLIAAWSAAAVAFSAPFAGRELTKNLAAPLFQGVYADAFIPGCLWLFALDFPHTPRLSRFDRFARLMAWVALGYGGLLVVANLLLSYGGVEALRFWARRGGSVGYWLPFVVWSLGATAAIFIRAVRAEPSERRRVVRFAAALLVGPLPFLIEELLLHTVPAVSAWARATPPSDGRLLVDVLVLGGFAVTPLATAVAAATDGTFKASPLLQRATQYALARATLTVVVLVSLAGSLVTIYLNRERPLAHVFDGPQAKLLLGCVVVAVLALLFRDELQAAVERWFIRAGSDARTALSRALTRLRETRSRREALALLVEEACRVLGTPRAVVVSPGRRELIHAEFGVATPIRADSVLIALAQAAAGPLLLPRNSAAFRLLPGEARTWLIENGLETLVALKGRADTPRGLLALGPKDDGLPCSESERWFLDNLALAVGAAWEPVASTSTAPLDDPETDSAVECARCGQTAPSMPMPCGCLAHAQVCQLPPVLNSRFVVVRRLGRGAMGVVYLGKDCNLGREVALKALPDLSGQAVSQLHCEARTMASLSHQALAHVYGLETWRDSPVLVMEYLAGGTLADRLRHGPLPLADAVCLVRTLAGGLRVLHGAGLLHCDIKPSNMGLTASGDAKLLDFGVATATVDARAAGTMMYWPPEAFQNPTGTPACDLWALNVVFFEAVTGIHPFRASTVDAVRRRIVRGLKAPAHGVLMPSWLLAYFKRALAVDRGRRLVHIDAMHASLAELAELAGYLRG